MKRLSSMFLCGILGSVLLLSGCKDDAATPLTSSPPASSLSATPSPSDPPMEVAATPDPVPETPVLYPYYIETSGAADSEMRPRLWGYMNTEGKTIIHPAFYTAGRFNPQGTAVASQLVDGNAQYGLIDGSGEFIVEPRYASIAHYDGIYVAEVKVNPDVSQNDLIAEDGHIIKSNIEGRIDEFAEGKAPIAVDDRYGIIDQTGNFLVEPQYGYIGPYVNGKAIAKIQDGVFTQLNNKGEQGRIYNVVYIAGASNNGLAVTRWTEDGKLGYMNEEGKQVIPPLYETAEYFQDGLAVVSLDYSESHNGLIDEQGNYVIQPEYGAIEYLGKSLWAASKANNQMIYNGEDVVVKYAIFNKKGEQLTDFIYDDVQPFQGDYAAVEQGITSFLIDETGHKSSAWPTVEGLGSLEIRDGILSVDIDNELKYISAQGDVIWEGEYVYELGNGAVLKQAKYQPDRNTVSYYPVLEGLENAMLQTQINDIFKKEGYAEEGEATASPDSEYEFGFDFDSNFSIMMHENNLLTVDFSSYSYAGGVHGTYGDKYLHVDLQTGKVYKLSDLFKPQSGYLKEINRILEEQIAENGEEKGVTEGLFDGIEDGHSFYIDNETLRIVFQPYEIGSFAAGFIAFDIPFEELDSSIDKEGAFWKSFH